MPQRKVHEHYEQQGVNMNNKVVLAQWFRLWVTDKKVWSSRLSSTRLPLLSEFRALNKILNLLCSGGAVSWLTLHFLAS